MSGAGCWDLFSGESGKHVVQRIPPTESRGRRHTSVVAVAVLPLCKHSDATAPPMSEIAITTQCGHGKGGQHQNKVETAVRAVHVPSGITVFINGRDQHRNKQLAIEILQARVADQRSQIIRRQHNQLKVEQLGSGNRSGKIRTYNFINSIVIDHRLATKTHKIADVMNGRFDLLRQR